MIKDNTLEERVIRELGKSNWLVENVKTRDIAHDSEF